MASFPPPPDNLDYYEEPRLHMEQLMSSSITDFDIPMRIAIPLDNAGIRRLRDLVKCSKKDLLKINRLGEKGVNEIIRILANFDLYLGMEVF